MKRRTLLAGTGLLVLCGEQRFATGVSSRKAASDPVARRPTQHSLDHLRYRPGRLAQSRLSKPSRFPGLLYRQRAGNQVNPLRAMQALQPPSPGATSRFLAPSVVISPAALFQSRTISGSGRRAAKRSGPRATPARLTREAWQIATVANEFHSRKVGRIMSSVFLLVRRQVMINLNLCAGGPMLEMCRWTNLGMLAAPLGQAA
jgi:hypothetical protein